MLETAALRQLFSAFEVIAKFSSSSASFSSSYKSLLVSIMTEETLGSLR